MAEELEKLWSKLSFTEEEGEGIEIDSKCTKAAREIGRNCVLMKILAHKSISIEALRKNMRMLWKPNKSVQISEVDEELFMVEFGDGRDKKKVLDMCPWSYEKQLVLLQEFDGKFTPKEVEMRWAPFWVQIFNLPLNCRTKEIGLAIGTKLGEVLETDVQESGVQWGTCLRVKVRLDVTKRLIRRKKILVEGGESKWVNFKYERLPNFCYRCGLLNHTLKECPENDGEKTNTTEEETLQYGAWMRGDFMRRYAQEQNRMSSDRGATDMRRWGGGGESEKRQFIHRENEISVGVVEAQDPRQPALEEIMLTQMKGHDGEGVIASGGLQTAGRSDKMEHENSMSEELPHENGFGDGVTEKKAGKGMDVGEGALGQDKTQTCGSESSLKGKSNGQKVKDVEKEKNVTEAEANSGLAGRMGLEHEAGPLAVIFNETKGWTEEKLGQNSRHWKRMAREAKRETKGEEKGPKSLKRGGQLSVSDLDPKAGDSKRRKEERKEDKQGSRSPCEDTVMVGGEAVAARQHRRAS